MMENDSLDRLLDSFGSGLREYIQSEVKRQVAMALNTSEMEEEEDADVGEVAAELDNSSFEELEALLAEPSVRRSKSDSSHYVEKLDTFGASAQTSTIEESAVLPDSTTIPGQSDTIGENNMETLLQMSQGSNQQSNVEKEDYLVKLERLGASASTPDVVEAPRVEEAKITGMGYAMQLLQNYKKKLSI